MMARLDNELKERLHSAYVKESGRTPDGWVHIAEISHAAHLKDVVYSQDTLAFLMDTEMFEVKKINGMSYVKEKNIIDNTLLAEKEVELSAVPEQAMQEQSKLDNPKQKCVAAFPELYEDEVSGGLMLEPDSAKVEKRIITEDEIQLFEKLIKERSTDWKTFSKRNWVNLWNKEVEKYSETAHFIYELIQNADDAEASEVALVLYEDKLVFKHNGKRLFTLTDDSNKDIPLGDINSITSAACSTKEDKEGTIGKFGLGFKSVFQYTDQPAIYDDKFWFKIDNFIIPSLLEKDHPLRNEYETLFEFPFKDKVKAHREIFVRLHDLRMPVLFLPHVKRIIWKKAGEEEVYVYAKTVLQRNTRHGIGYELCCFQECDKIYHAYIFHRMCPVLDGEHEIFVAYFVNEDGTLKMDIPSTIYCFFPMKETFEGCFVSHAPFLLTESRESIKEYEEVNDIFLKAIAQLAADALLCLRDISLNRNEYLLEGEDKTDLEYKAPSNSLLNDNIYSILNIEIKSDSDRNKDLRDRYMEVAHNHAIFITRSGKYDFAKYVLNTSDRIASLFTAEQLSALWRGTKHDFIAQTKNSSDWQDRLDQIGIELFNNESIAEKLTSSFMASQSKEWINRFLNYIEDNAKSLWTERNIGDRIINIKMQYDSWSKFKYRFAPIAKTSRGEWIAPYTLLNEQANLVLPYEGFEDVEVDAFGKVLDKDIYEAHQNFYNQLNLHKPDILDYVEKKILIHYEEESVNQECLIDDFHTIYKILNDSGKLEYLIDEVKKKLKLMGFNSQGKVPTAITELKLPDEKLMNFIGQDSDTRFVDVEFYVSEDKGLTKEKITKFLKDVLGIGNLPKILPKGAFAIDREYTDHSWLDYFYDDFPSKFVKYLDNLRSDNLISKSNGPSYQDYDLEGYNGHVTSKEWSHSLWDYLLELRVYENKNAVLYYYRYHKKYPEKVELDSILFEHLKRDKWICTGEGTFCSPSEITRSQFHELGYQESDELEPLLDFLREKTEEDIQQELIDRATSKGINVNDLISKAIEQSENDPSYLSDSIAFKQIRETMGSDNLQYFAAHAEDVADLFAGQYGYTSKVKSITNYIGKKIYEQYLKNNKVPHELLDSNDPSGCDFVLNDGKRYVRVITTQKSIMDNHIPVGLSATQNAFLRSHADVELRVIRISLADISVMPAYNTIIGVHGKLEDPYTDERLQRDCDKIAKQYWHGTKIEEFDKVSPEYLIRIDRKN